MESSKESGRHKILRYSSTAAILAGIAFVQQGTLNQINETMTYGFFLDISLLLFPLRIAGLVISALLTYYFLRNRGKAVICFIGAMLILLIVSILDSDLIGTITLSAGIIAGTPLVKYVVIKPGPEKPKEKTPKEEKKNIYEKMEEEKEKGERPKTLKEWKKSRKK